MLKNSGINYKEAIFVFSVLDWIYLAMEANEAISQGLEELLANWMTKTPLLTWQISDEKKRNFITTSARVASSAAMIKEGVTFQITRFY